MALLIATVLSSELVDFNPNPPTTGEKRYDIKFQTEVKKVPVRRLTWENDKGLMIDILEYHNFNYNINKPCEYIIYEIERIFYTAEKIYVLFNPRENKGLVMLKNTFWPLYTFSKKTKWIMFEGTIDEVLNWSMIRATLIQGHMYVLFDISTSDIEPELPLPKLKSNERYVTFEDLTKYRSNMINHIRFFTYRKNKYVNYSLNDKNVNETANN